MSLTHATEGPIGNFQEYFFKHPAGSTCTTRRLLPAVPGISAVSDELVFGDYWLHPRFAAQAPEHIDSPEEIKEINRRFTFLMEELEDDL